MADILQRILTELRIPKFNIENAKEIIQNYSAYIERVKAKQLQRGKIVNRCQIGNDSDIGLTTQTLQCIIGILSMSHEVRVNSDQGQINV